MKKYLKKADEIFDGIVQNKNGAIENNNETEE
jgi:hypothetical protein